MAAGFADFLNDRVALLCLNDPLVRDLRVLVSGHEHESVWVFAHALVLLDAKHHRFEAAWIGALAEERHPICAPKVVALGGTLQPFIRSAESRLVRRELVSTSLLIHHEKCISARPKSTHMA